MGVLHMPTPAGHHPLKSCPRHEAPPQIILKSVTFTMTTDSPSRAPPPTTSRGCYLSPPRMATTSELAMDGNRVTVCACVLETGVSSSPAALEPLRLLVETLVS